MCKSSYVKVEGYLYYLPTNNLLVGCYQVGSKRSNWASLGTGTQQKYLPSTIDSALMGAGSLCPCNYMQLVAICN
jgi:hypothetical protein